MSRMDVLGEGRQQGMAFALKICKDAQAAGQDPVEALEKEMTFRYRTRIIVLATSKELDQASEAIKATTIKTMLSASLIVLWEQFRFGKKRSQRFADAFMTYTRALAEGSITWYEITDLLKEKTDIEVDLSDDNILGKGKGS